MPIQTTLMVIADIGGYTRFIRENRTTLAHAHFVINTLLEAVIKAVGRQFTLSKLEGDAAFLYMTVKGDRPEDLSHLVDAAAEVHRVFHTRLELMRANTLCGCEACNRMDKLYIKVVAHIGDALFTRIRRMTELAGEHVIRVHRMLKNDVPIPEYILCSPEIAAHLTEDLKRRTHEVAVHMEGFGDTRAYYLDLEDLAAELPAPRVFSWPVRAFYYVWHDLLTLPYVLGIKKPLAGFRNFPGE